MNVAITVLSGSERWQWPNPDLAHWLLQNARPPDGVEIHIDIATANNWPVSRARNNAAQGALDVGADWCLELDNDCVPPADFIEMLQVADARGIDFLAAVSPTWRENHQIEFVVQGLENGAVVDGLFQEVAAVGGGCIAFRTKVLTSIERPWFRIEPNDDLIHKGLGDCIGEDNQFCRALRAVGIKLFVAKNRLAGHYKTGNLLEIRERWRRDCIWPTVENASKT